MMDVLPSETCWALNNEIIKQVTSSWSLFIQPLRMAGKRQMMHLTVELCQWQQTNAKWKSETCPLTHTQHFTHGNCYRSRYLSSNCLLNFHQLLGEMKKVCVKWIPNVLKDDHRATQVFLTIIHLQHRRNEDNAFLDQILTVDESWMH